MKLIDGTTVIEADSFQLDESVFIVNGDERVPLPVGDYELEDSNILKVEVEGIIAAIEPPAEEEPAKEEPIETPAEQEMEAATSNPKKIVESVSKEIFFAEIEKLRKEIDDLKLAKEVIKEKLGSDIIVEPLTHSPEYKSEIKLNKISPNRQMTTQDRVMAQLFN
jgi:hypothetical protein